VYTLEGIQLPLPEDRALIGWLSVPLGNNTSYTWGYVIRKTGPVKWVKLDREEPRATEKPTFLERTRTFRDKLVLQPRGRHASGPRGDHQDATALGSHWVRPFAFARGGITHLIVIPSGPLLGIPSRRFAMPTADP